MAFWLARPMIEAFNAAQYHAHGRVTGLLKRQHWGDAVHQASGQ
jgi:hypothetical protein